MASPEGAGHNPWESVQGDLDEGLSLPAFLFDPMGVLQRRWVWMLVAVLIGLLVTGVSVHQSKPTYIAQASVLLTSQQIPEDFVRSTVREDAISNINAMVGKVLSRENLSRLIREHDLFPDPAPETTMDDLTNVLRSAITVEPQGSVVDRRGYQNSMIYVISYRSQDAERAAEVANALAGLFMEASIERRGELARLTTEFLSRQLDRDESELRTQSQEVSEFRREHRGQLPNELDTNLRRLEMLSERTQTLSNQIAAKENRILTLESLPQTGANTQNETLLEEMRRELARQIAAHTDEHPNVIALRERVARQTEVVDEEREALGGSAVIAAERRDLALMQEQLAETQGDTQDLTLRIDATPAVGDQLMALQEKEMVLRERYLDSLRKVEEAQLAENLESAQQGAQVSILDSAHQPTTPERPRWLLAVAGIVASLGLGVGVMILLELLDPVIVNTRQLDRLGDAPCVGSLPLHV